MTIGLNSRFAEAIATNHENQVKGPAKERSMDLANNATGRSVGASKSYKTFAKAKARCQSLASNGKLKTLK